MKFKNLWLSGGMLRAPEGDAPDPGNAPPSGPPSDPPADLPPLVGEDLSFAEGYQDRIGEYAKDATYKNLADVFKTAREGQKTITQLNQEKAELTKKLEAAGQKPKELPADSAAFKEALKLPEMPEGVQLDDAVLDAGIEFAREKGYGPEDLAAFLEFDIQRAKLESEAEKTEAFDRVGKAKEAIIEAVGEQNYERTIADAKAVSQTLGLPLEAEDLVNQPNMVVALAKLSAAISEGTLKGIAPGNPTMSGASKLGQAEDIVANPENPLHAAFHDPSHPQYDTAQATHARLISESAA